MYAFRYKLLLNTDASQFGGHDRVVADCEYFAEDTSYHDRAYSMMVCTT